MAAVALFHHAARVEHRVVDADGEADDHDELGDVGREPVELAERAEQADRGRDGGGAEHEREPGGDERAERDEQDDQHQAVGDELGLLAVLGVLGGDLLGGRRVAELLDAHAGVRLLRGGDGGQRLVDELLGVLVGAGDREVHDDRAAVLGDRVRAVALLERALDLGDARDRVEPEHDVLDGGHDLRIADTVALHEHPLTGLLGEAGGVDDHVAALGLAVALRRFVDVVLADLAAEDGGQDDERDPAEDGRLAVLRTPTTGTSREVPGLHKRGSSFRGGGEELSSRLPPLGSPASGGSQASPG